MPITSRDYQNDACIRVLQELNDHDAVILQAPTGSGKTIMAMLLIDYVRREMNGRTVFLAPRRELVDQTADKLEMVDFQFGHDYGVIMAGEALSNDLVHLPIQVASKDTLRSRVKRRALGLPQADLVLVDEAHLSLSKTWLELIEEYIRMGAKVVGLTATPARGDGRGLGLLYTQMIQCPSVRELTDMGYLCEATYYAPTKPDLEGIKKDYKKHDYREGELQDRMSSKQIVGDIVTNWLKQASGCRTVVFCCGVKHSILVAERFCAEGVRAEHVDGNTPTAERKEIFARFRSGETQVLTNCMLATYGFDLPEMDCVVLARPTMSIILHLQMLGRGLRPAEGKDRCIVLDHAGNIERLGFADDPVPWSLSEEGNLYSFLERERTKKEREGITCGACSYVYRSSRECPACGWEPPQKKGRDVDVLEGELVQLSRGKRIVELQEIQTFYLRMRGLLLLKGKNEHRAYYLTKEKYAGFDAPRGWQQLEPMQPTEVEEGYLRHANIRYAKRRRAA